ncbi:MAG: YgdI/YgdR family lipoprotein [Clostridiales bacterium]|nr:YgdI/YgdR family lipoprotein [Clostridiales bacterium]
MKKYITLTFALVLAFLLTACRSNSSVPPDINGGDITAGSSPSAITLKDIIIGEWIFVRATDKYGNADDEFDVYDWGTRTRYVEIRFDNDGSFYQRSWTNNTGYVDENEEPGGWNEWECEGTYIVDGNDITFNLNNEQTAQEMFWRDGEIEVGEFFPETKELQYRTNYNVSFDGKVVYCYFVKSDSRDFPK